MFNVYILSKYRLEILSGDIISIRSKEKESDELLYTVMVRNQLPAQVVKIASTSRSLATRYLQGIHILWYRFVSIKNWSVPMNIFRWSWEVRAMMGLILSSLPFEVCAFICWAVGGFWHLREVGVLDKVFMNYFGMVLMFLICLV